MKHYSHYRNLGVHQSRDEDDPKLNGPTVVAGCRLVVACHACQHLAREIIDLCMAHNTAFAVCPCCPKDHQGQLAL